MYTCDFEGWRMERQQLPDSLHFSILPQHIGQESKLISDLEVACKESWVRENIQSLFSHCILIFSSCKI